MKKYMPFWILILLLSCNSKKSFECNCDTRFLAYNDSIINKILIDTASFNREQEYCQIENLKTIGKESFRLKMYHSFSKYTQYYTLTKERIGAKIEVLQFKETNDNFWRTQLDKKYVLNLSQKQWESIKKEIDTSCFWTNEFASCRPPVIDGGHWRLEGFDPEKNNCTGRDYHIDFCSYACMNKLGNICRTMRKYAHEERLNIYE